MPKHADGRAAHLGNHPIGIPGRNLNRFASDFSFLPENGVLEPTFSPTGQLWASFGNAQAVEERRNKVQQRATELLSGESFDEIKVLLMIICLGFLEEPMRKSTLEERLRWLAESVDNETAIKGFGKVAEFSSRLYIEIEQELVRLNAGFFTSNVINQRFYIDSQKTKSLYLRVAKLKTIHMNDDNSFRDNLRRTLDHLGYDLNFRPQFAGRKIAYFLGAPIVSDFDMNQIDSHLDLKQLYALKRFFDEKQNSNFDRSVIVRAKLIPKRFLSFDGDADTDYLLVLFDTTFDRNLFVRVNQSKIEVATFLSRPPAKRVSRILNSNWQVFAHLGPNLDIARIDYEKVTNQLLKSFGRHINMM